MTAEMLPDSEPMVTAVLTMGPGEGAGCAMSIAAFLAQDGCEVMLADHGADGDDRAALPADPRLTVLRMAPCARATARNRTLAHCAGAWLWVLAPGDCPAPHAIATLSVLVAQRQEAELLFLPGVLAHGNGAVTPHPGQEILGPLLWGAPDIRAALALLPPAAPMRLVRRSLVARAALRFADDLAGGSVPFVTGALLEAEATAIADLPLFSRPTPPEALAPTASPREDALAAVAAAAKGLELVAASRFRHAPLLRLSFLAATGRMLADHARPLRPEERGSFDLALAVMLRRMAEPLRWSLHSPDAETEDAVSQRAAWAGEALKFLRDHSGARSGG